MDNRFLLWAGVGLLWLMLYQTWQMDYAPRPPAADAPTAPEAGTDTPPSDSFDGLPALPGAELSAAPDTPGISVGETAPVVSVLTDVYDLRIDTAGALVRDVTLRRYPKKKDQPDDLISLLSEQAADLELIQSGVVSANGAPAPDHEKRFRADSIRYELADGDEYLDVPLTWRGPNGLEATKTFRFYRGRYNIDVSLELRNNGTSTFAGAPYVQLQRADRAMKRSMVEVDSYSFIGPVVYDGDSADKYKPKDLRKNPINFSTPNGWIATIQHHFLSAVIPAAGEVAQYTSRVNSNNRELISAVLPVVTLQSGESHTHEHTLFVGPKFQKQLEETAPGLVRTVDYGFLSVLSQPLFWLLQKIHGVVNNWGWAIIIMTIFIKMLFYPLAQKSGRSMAKMRKLAPRMKLLQERYKDDRPALSREMMNLYKTEGANPMSSCLPLLLQMPVFLALYWVLIESVELRQAPFALWITDLSSRDPYFILPLIMAGAMFVQTKLNPPPADPTTAKVMTIMPIMMSVFFAFFPAGLVLYWVVNTVLSVLQQWRINRVVEAAG